MFEEELVAKFEACTRSLSARRRRRTIDRALALETAESIEEMRSECT